MDDLLHKLTLEELCDFIRHHAERYDDFENQFRLYFAYKFPTIDIKEGYRQIVKRLVIHHIHKGFVDYNSAFNLQIAMLPLLRSGEQALVLKRFDEAAAISIALCTEILPVLAICDDSGNHISGILSEGIVLLHHIAQHPDLPPALAKETLKAVEHLLLQPGWWDYGSQGDQLLAVKALLL